MFIIGNWRETTKIRDLGSVCISVDLLPIQLKLRDDVYSLDKVKLKFGLLDCVRYVGDFVIPGFCSIHSTVTLAGLKNVFRYTTGFRYIGVPL